MAGGKRRNLVGAGHAGDLLLAAELLYVGFRQWLISFHGFTAFNLIQNFSRGGKI
jgi:hypothetical protein